MMRRSLRCLGDRIGCSSLMGFLDPRMPRMELELGVGVEEMGVVLDKGI